MSRVSGCLWLGVALVLALLAGGAAFITLQKATVGQAAAASPVATTPVLVAIHPVSMGALLTDADLTVATVPQNALPAGALSAPKDASGQITTVPLNTGEMILVHHLTKPDITSGAIGFAMPQGKVAVTLDSQDLLSSTALVQPNDHVDILYSLRIKRPSAASSSGQGSSGQSSEDQQYTFGTLLNVTVVRVIESALKEKPAVPVSTGASAAPVAAGPARAYILALDPQDALTLKYLKDAGAVMDLALRNTTDEGDHTAKPVDINYLVDKYQLPVCQQSTCQMPVR